jgi:hypothetical protein
MDEMVADAAEEEAGDVAQAAAAHDDEREVFVDDNDHPFIFA